MSFKLAFSERTANVRALMRIENKTGVLFHAFDLIQSLLIGRIKWWSIYGNSHLLSV